MIDIRAVSRYARALFGLAEKTSQLDIIDDQLLAVWQIIQKHPEVDHLVSNSTVTLKEKEDFIEKIFAGKISSLLSQFLKVLIKKQRFSELGSIQEMFHRIYERLRRIEEVTAISAVALSKENESRLKTTLEKKLKSDINLITKVDPKMIGGLIIRFGGNEINASFRSRLSALHQNLSASI